MQIREITVGWAETVSLPEYSNVRPSFQFAAVLEEDDDPVDVYHKLLAQAKRLVRLEVDGMLEANGKPPKYWTGPRFQVLKSRDRKAIIIMKNETNDWPENFVHSLGIPRGIRWEIAEERAANLGKRLGWAVIDCTADDFDFSTLPQPQSKKLAFQLEDTPDGEVTFGVEEVGEGEGEIPF